ncbi:hypothetical protein PR202_gb23324 [Eleusine coracana subsp. coracana]|uniref:Wall-associated receptor kinase galacturonan-binding domain-containing protein n=1 Tax=Eleusine coracana subsp. coracana TaxID=191504 RepID=A0AAV5FIP0_ELECO|nr:hypothetical protein PR202_gb23324 [Eleusine coracana subsp. coracana]
MASRDLNELQKMELMIHVFPIPQVSSSAACLVSIIIALLATHGVITLLQLSAAASATAAPAPMGLRPRCDTWCGHVRVPFPFGISPNCSYPAPGFNLTCDRSTHPPRLLLGDGTLQVDEISLLNSTVRVVGTGGVRIGRGGVGVWRGAGMGDDDAGPFALMPGDFNELVVTGCNMQATVRVGNDTES